MLQSKKLSCTVVTQLADILTKVLLEEKYAALSKKSMLRIT